MKKEALLRTSCISSGCRAFLTNYVECCIICRFSVSSVGPPSTRGHNPCPWRSDSTVGHFLNLEQILFNPVQELYNPAQQLLNPVQTSAGTSSTVNSPLRMPPRVEPCDVLVDWASFSSRRAQTARTMRLGCVMFCEAEEVSPEKFKPDFLLSSILTLLAD